MRKSLTAFVLVAAVATSGCAAFKGRRNPDDEFTVARSAPLVVPPDFNLAPPVTGTVGPVAVGCAAAGDRRLVRRPRAAQPGRDDACSSRPTATSRRSAFARPCGTRIRASSTRARRRWPSCPAPAVEQQRRLRPGRPVTRQAGNRTFTQWLKPISPDASSKSNRCSTAPAAASKKARGWSRKPTNCSPTSSRR